MGEVEASLSFGSKQAELKLLKIAGAVEYAKAAGATGCLRNSRK